MRIKIPGKNETHEMDCTLVEEGSGKRRWQARCRIPCEGFSFTRVSVPKSVREEGAASGVGEDTVETVEPAASQGFVYLEGYASSSSVDWHGTEMSVRALSNMESQFKSGVPYVPSHRDDEWDQVFGRTVDAQIVSGEVQLDGDIQAPNNGLLLNVRVALDAEDSRTKKLVRSLNMGNTVGMSIGGWFTDMEVITNDDDEVERMIIHAVDLDHLATTRRPSNPDTWITEMHRSVSEAVKSVRSTSEKVERFYDSADDFEPHNMYNPETGDKKFVETYEEHLQLVDEGWVHEEEIAEDDLPDGLSSEGLAGVAITVRSATEFANLPVAPIEMPFNPEEVPDKDIRQHILDMFTTKEGPGWGELRKANLWYDESNPEELEGYKYIIARPYDPDDPENVLTENGDLYVFEDAVSKALQNLADGPNIPEEDIAACTEHAEKYIEKWSSEEAPLEDNEMKGGGKKEDKYRAIMPYGDLAFAEPMDASWSFDLKAEEAILYEGRDEDDPDWERYGEAHVYVDRDKLKEKGGYKLPIAKLIDGELKVYWKGVVAAMGAVNGARGGVDISDDDRQEAYKYLSKYYEKADKEPPEFSRCVILDETVIPDLDKAVETGQSSQQAVDAQRGATGISTNSYKEGHSMSDQANSEATLPAEEDKVTLEVIARSLAAQTELLKAVVESSQKVDDARTTPAPEKVVETAQKDDESEMMRSKIATLEARIATLAATPQRVGRAKQLANHHLDRTTGTYGTLVRSAETTMGDSALYAVCKAQSDRRDASTGSLPTRGELLEDLRAVLAAAYADGVITDPDTRAGWR